MKTIATTQRNTASTLHAHHSTHNVHSPLRRLTLLVALLMTFALGARAADYVITYSSDGTTYYLGMNGNNLQAKTTFDITCVWTCINGNTETTLGNDSRSLRNRNNSSYYLTTSCTRSGYYNNYTYTWSSLSVQTTASNIWLSNNSNIYAYYSTNTGWGSWNRSASINVQSLTMIDNNTNSSKNVQVTITDISTTSTNPTINGNDVLTATGNYTYTASGAAYQAGGYTNYYFNSENHYYNSDNSAITPKAAALSGTAWSITANEFATINNSGVVAVNRIPTSDVTLIITATVSVTGGTGTPAAPAGTTLVGTKEITIQGSVPAAPTISVSGTTVTLQTDATGTTSIRYTIDGTDPTATTGTVYSGAFDISGSTNSPVTIKAITVRNGNASSVTTQQTKLTLPEPVITVNATTGTATITCSNSSATIYYTTDGSAPSATNDTQYNGQITGLTPMTTVKAIAICDGWNSSSVASATVTIPSGVSSEGTVTLFDLEDHNWTYYSGVDRTVDGGNYNDNYAGKLYSPNPRNVKITYNANGGAVSIDESETSFVYFKTLEQGATAGQYPYTVISNPFSKRPTDKGFGGWKIINGGEYINGYNNGSTLPLDQEITFVNLPYPSTNCISAEIVLEATWVNAQVTYLATNNDYTFNVTNGSSTTYENNFLVINRSYSGTLTLSQPVTIMMVEPDGSDNFRDDYTFTGNITPNNTGVTKIEFAKWNPNGNINATGRNVTLGRGLTMGGTGRTIYGTNSNLNINQVFKIESGTYNTFYAIGSSGPNNNMTKQLIILGNDYDRANKGGDNSKLSITNNMYLLGKSSTIGTDKLKIIAKSGKFTPNLDHSTAQASGNCFYLWYNSGGGSGTRELVIEGGEFWHIAGGYDSGNSNNSVNLKIRMKGGTIHGSIYGGAAKYDTKGYKQFIFTGGTVEGWIAGGSNGYLANGDDNLNGTVDGRSYVYIGGKTQVTSGNSTTAIDMSVGGNVYGAGCGNTTVNNSGRVTNQTNVVIADECYVQRGVYGGGAYGSSPGTANVYITGNAHVGGVYESTFDVYGGVYGGARAKDGGSTNIYMTGGDVEHGVYGGSNLTGTINNNVTMQINGGQVGTSSAPANIHGGGYGQATRVSGDVEVTLGTEKQATGGVTVYGDVYGGSALGYVNGTTATDTYHTHVTMNKGTIYGSLYGGALGSNTVPANVYGPVEVKVYGGSVKKVGDNEGSGGVYGANNINGAPQRSVTVDIYGTDPAPAEGEYALHAVYGGGNQAPYTYGNGYPKVTVHYCDNSIEYIYGGGNAADVASTDVTIWGGDVIGNVFGGGNGTVSAANVNGNATTRIHGGTILNVYGGSNSQGTINGAISVLVDSQGEGEKDPCKMNIGSVYGGGNLAASKVGNLTITCTGTDGRIDNVYGGANQANITGDIDLKINGGNIGNVFGGNNIKGDISGTISVTVGDDPNDCGVFKVDNVYGAGNLAPYGSASGTKGNYPVVNIYSGTVTNNVFGGGLGESAIVYGNPQVTIGDNNVGHEAYEVTIGGDVYGGGDAANVEGIPVVNIVNKCNTTIGNVYGGGNAADVNGTDVNIDGGTITGMVFGGGHGDKNANPQTEANVKGNVNVDITGGTINKVFGGSNSKGNITGTIALNIEKGDESCEMHITEVYGGGNEAAGNAGTITIGCTGGEGEGIGDVYGGANAADINTPITLNITGGNISRVFGGNNTSGSINGDIQVNVDWTGTCGVNALGNVYGAGNQAAYSGNTEVNILNGTVTGSVYGGGLGATADVTGTTTVNIDGSAEDHSVAVTQNVLGGGDAAAVTGSTDVNIINGAISGSVFGGGNAAGVSENGVVDVTGGTIASGVYGGSNASGTVGNTTVTLANGIIGTDAAHANVHGGGYGKNTEVSGNVAVNIQGGTIYGDVYGGSALGTVNTNTSNTTAVNLTGGIIHGDAYGGGLGDSDTAADVNGNVTVTLNGTAFTLATTTDDSDKIIPTSGRIFGCNNINGSPKGTVLVKVLKTVARDGEGNVKAKPTPNSGVYELQAVYGGGNLAAYNPTNPAADGQFTSYTYGGNTVAHDNTDKPVQVVIDGCGYTSIEYVYGGGNAAATPATDVTVLGSYEIGSVFGGGNGKDKYTLDGGTTWNENNGADVGIIDAEAYSSNKSQGKYGTGDAMTSVLGGTVHNIFGGSNTLGNIVGEAIAYLDAASDCELNVDGIYGGGNEAYMDGSSGIQLGCITYLKEIYGGARNADVGGDINLTITSGHFDRVFGGNNLGGLVKGSITVNIEETGCNPITIGELYGCGNKAAYETPGDRHPTINIRSFTSIGNVYGGGLGEDAVVKGNPTININVVKGANNAVTGWSYNGKTIDFGDGNTVTLPLHETGKIGAIGNVFGGGNAAEVIGNTQVNIGTETSVVFESLTGAERTKTVEGVDIRGNVYGGGNQAKVTGKTNVVIGRK